MAFRFLLLVVLSLPAFCNAQFDVSGQIIDSKTSKPITGASVFITNTSIGTVTDQNGKFFLHIPTPQADVVMSAVEYKTKVLTITESNSKIAAMVLMEPTDKTLEAVVIQSALTDGWEKWGKFFIDNFLGVTKEAERCKIQNPKALKFAFDKLKNELTVWAKEPIKISNKALGYELEYTLENFSYNGKTKVVFYTGYPFFKEINAGAAKQAKWLKNRQECFTGSTMHFFRSLYRNQLATDGFTIQPVTRAVNTEKKRVKKRMLDLFVSGNNIGDSAAYFDRIMAQPDSLNTIYSPISADSVAYMVQATTAGFYFDNLLLITYKNGKASPDIQELLNDRTSLRSSFIYLMSNEPIMVMQDGSIYNPANLMLERYWSVSEKVARMLPFDYKP